MALRALTTDERDGTHRTHEPFVFMSFRRAQPLQSPILMSDQQNRQRRPSREEPTMQASGGEDTRARKALDERWQAVRRWISEDDESCCRGID